MTTQTEDVRSGGWWALSLLVAIYVLSFVDRTILSSLGEAIRHELGLSDTQLGLLGGLAFALTYSVLGVPVAFLSERVSRKAVITIAVVIWSVMTMLCGLAGGFASLLLLRAGVGIGEAGFTPPAHALLSDFFPPHRRAFALSLFSAAIPIGVLVAALGGGWLVHSMGWRGAFVVVGLPGLVLAPLLWLTMREPQRGEAEGGGAHATLPARRVVRHLARRRSAWYLVVGGAFASMPGYAVFTFGVSFLIRRHGLGIVPATVIFGAAVAGGQLVGMLAGGRLSERVSRRGAAWLLVVPAISLVAGGLLQLAAWHQESIVGCAVLLTLGMAAGAAYLGPSYAALHGLMTPRMRASGMSIVLLVHALVGLGLGPPIIGMISDRVATGDYVGAYAADCRTPGSHAPAPMKATCASASADGIKAGLSAAALFGLLAAAMMLLAGRRYEHDSTLEENA